MKLDTKIIISISLILSIIAIVEFNYPSNISPVANDNIITDDNLKTKNGIVEDYYDSGELRSSINYKNGKLHGIAKTYYLETIFPSEPEKHGILSEANYKDGKKNGISKIYYKHDELSSTQPFSKNDKVINGISKPYYEFGVLKAEATFKDGNAHGIAKTYYKSGVLKIEANWRNGSLNGISKSYDMNANPHWVVNYKDGILNGISKYYGENPLSVSSYLSEILYKDNEAISGVYYKENGSVKRKMTNAELHMLNNTQHVHIENAVDKENYRLNPYMYRP